MERPKKFVPVNKVIKSYTRARLCHNQRLKALPCFPALLACDHLSKRTKQCQIEGLHIVFLCVHTYMCECVCCKR